MPDYNPPNPARMKVAKPPVLQQGVHHQTPAVKQLHALAHAGTTGTRKRKKKGHVAKGAKTHKAHKAKKAHTKTRSGKSHLVAGSAAAKKHMAALRKLRGKKAASG